MESGEAALKNGPVASQKVKQNFHVTQKIYFSVSIERPTGQSRSQQQMMGSLGPGIKSENYLVRSKKVGLQESRKSQQES